MTTYAIALAISSGVLGATIGMLIEPARSWKLTVALGIFGLAAGYIIATADDRPKTATVATQVRK